MRFLVTAGPTHEPLDDVRYVANRSSGRMGIAIAQAAERLGHATTLLLGPVSLQPTIRSCLRFHTAADLERLLERETPDADVLVMAAAVADFRPPRRPAGTKIARGDALTITFEAVPDLLAGIARARAARGRITPYLVGFALEEPAQLAERATGKLRRKGIDAIVANPLATMDAASIEGCVYFADGSCAVPPVDSATAPGSDAATDQRPLIDKDRFAAWLVELIARRVRERGPA